MTELVYDPPMGPLQVLHEDRDLLVIAKPSGLLSVPGRVHRDSAYSRVLELHPLAQVVHRLDMDTSGVMLLALRRKAERHLKAQFRDRSVEKVYRARVQGRVAQDAGLIDLPLAHAGTWPPTSRVDPDGRSSQTRYRVLQRDGSSSLLELVPLTGRSHQLRVHLLSLGHPIQGDRFYGNPASQAAAPRLLLHAWRLSVDHPWSGERLHFEAPLPTGLS